MTQSSLRSYCLSVYLSIAKRRRLLNAAGRKARGLGLVVRVVALDSTRVVDYARLFDRARDTKIIERVRENRVEPSAASNLLISLSRTRARARIETSGLMTIRDSFGPASRYFLLNYARRLALFPAGVT